MAFPTTPILDTFNGLTAGNNLSAVDALWSAFSGFGIPELQTVGGNQITSQAGTGNSNYYNVATYVDAEIYVTVATLMASGEFLSLGWANTSLQGYDVLYTHGAPGNVIIRRLDTGVPTTLATFSSVTLAAGDKLGYRRIGNTFEAWQVPSGSAQAATPLGTTTDPGSPYTTARNIGFTANGTTVRLDDFGGGAMKAAPFLAPRLPLALLAR